MKRHTIKDAAIKALQFVGRPLSVKEIFNTIIEQDLYTFNAEFPENILKVEIRRHCDGVDFPTAKPNKIFQILSDGTYWIKNVPIPGKTLSQSTVDEIYKKDTQTLKSIVSKLRVTHLEYTSAFKRQILNQLKQIDPQVFESFSRKLLEVYGFIEVEITKYYKDGGIDGFGKLKVGITHLNVAFQCKRWKTANIGRTEVDKFRGAIQGSYEQGIIITTANFSKDALNATRKNGAVPIILIDGETLVNIMIEKQFGVETEELTVYINALDRALTEEI